MYLRFVADILVLSIIFRLLLALTAIPLGLLHALTNTMSDEKSQFWSAAATQILINILFAGFLGVSVAAFHDLYDISHPWLYSLSGFFIAFGVLADNVRGKQQDPAVGLSPIAAGSFDGANIGFPVGLITYWVLFASPALFLFIPGAATLFGWAVGIAGWITGFLVIRILILIAALSWIFKVGAMLLFFGAMATFGVLSVFRPKTATQTVE